MNKKIYKLVLASVFCALVFTLTWVSFPAPAIGNVNMGDCMVILCACILGGPYAVAAAALGAALCDLASAYAIYAPGTLVIKALMVLVILLMRKFVFKKDNLLSVIIPGACAEVMMIVGYFAYEALVLGYGFGAIANAPFNAIQGAIGLIAASLLYSVLKKAGILKVITENRNR